MSSNTDQILSSEILKSIYWEIEPKSCWKPSRKILETQRMSYLLGEAIKGCLQMNEWIGGYGGEKLGGEKQRLQSMQPEKGPEVGCVILPVSQIPPPGPGNLLWDAPIFLQQTPRTQASLRFLSLDQSVLSMAFCWFHISSYPSLHFHTPTFPGDFWGKQPERRKVGRGIKTYWVLTMRNERSK